MPVDFEKKTDLETYRNNFLTTDIFKALATKRRLAESGPTAYETWVPFARAANRAGNMVSVPEDVWLEHGEKMTRAGYPREIYPLENRLTPDQELDLGSKAELMYPGRGGEVTGSYGRNFHGVPSYETPEGRHGKDFLANTLSLPQPEQEQALESYQASGRNPKRMSSSMPEAFGEVARRTVESDPMTRHNIDIYNQSAQQAPLQTEQMQNQIQMQIQQLESMDKQQELMALEIAKAGGTDPDREVIYMRSLVDDLMQGLKMSADVTGEISELERNQVIQDAKRVWDEDIVPRLQAQGIKPEKLDILQYSWQGMVDSALRFVDPYAMAAEQEAGATGLRIDDYEPPSKKQRRGHETMGTVTPSSVPPGSELQDFYKRNPKLLALAGGGLFG